ncbi:MAG TPA: 16S rRNA (guanine(527)-N(7))-methyltransferase RsmG [Streptosporangiaceae bacterium]|nr:16S rRNA (guanine(527)-N(7))-methyltransferase RsmG [Streptosporangiaceae bacterium]
MAAGRPAPAPPDQAVQVFGAALPAACAYAQLLVGPAVERGLIGPAETDRIWDRHLLNSAVLAGLIPPRCRLVDLGSGAGLPGVVLAMILPEAEVTLLEPMARRTAFLSECVRELDLPNVSVTRGRAEDLAGRMMADVVVARAVARLDRLAVLAAGLARPGGLVLALKGAAAAQELQAAGDVLARVAVGPAKIVSAGDAVLSEPATVVRFVTREAARRRARPDAAGKRARRRPGQG